MHPKMTYDIILELKLIAMSKDVGMIPDVLSEMGNKYADILQSNKRPLLPYDDYHKRLLALLQNQGYIKSFHKEKGQDKLRVYH